MLSKDSVKKSKLFRFLFDEGFDPSIDEKSDSPVASQWILIGSRAFNTLYVEPFEAMLKVLNALKLASDIQFSLDSFTFEKTGSNISVDIIFVSEPVENISSEAFLENLADQASDEFLFDDTIK